MRMQFENENGRIDIGGGGSMHWKATSVSGLDYPKKEFNTARYGKTAGQRTLSSAYLARTITIAGDIRRDGVPHETARAIRVLDSPGILTVCGRLGRRKIACYCTAFETGEKQGDYTPFTLQLTCDDPFFKDTSETVVDLFRRVDLIKDTFQFPMVFTRRYTDADILITGDCDVLPVFRIYNTPKEIAAFADARGIEIKNETTGQVIGIDCTTVPGEVITVDVARREIISSVRGDIIADITDETFLDRFWLQKGKNHVSVTNYNTSEEISVVCAYENRYLEAIL